VNEVRRMNYVGADEKRGDDHCVRSAGRVSTQYKPQLALEVPRVF
jgi:hypothetical protein